MSNVSNRMSDFIDSHPDSMIETIFGITFTKDNLDKDGLFFEQSMNTLFNNLYKEGYLDDSICRFIT